MFRETRFTASFEERPAYLAAQLASRGRLWRWESPVSELAVKVSQASCVWLQRGFRGQRIDLPSPVIPSPNNTPASSRMAAGDLESGGPGSELSFSKVS
jgi:hypothetical protein